MAKKSIKGADLAAGFFSQPAVSENTETEDVKETATMSEAAENEKPPKNESELSDKKTEPTKNVGGRPKKKGLKNEQFTLTMNPETYEKLRIVADEHTRGNFSGLIDDAIQSYCKENGIDLSAIEVDPKILDIYRDKQEKKAKKNKK